MTLAKIAHVQRTLGLRTNAGLGLAVDGDGVDDLPHGHQLGALAAVDAAQPLDRLLHVALLERLDVDVALREVVCMLAAGLYRCVMHTLYRGPHSILQYVLTGQPTRLPWAHTRPQGSGKPCWATRV